MSDKDYSRTCEFYVNQNGFDKCTAWIHSGFKNHKNGWCKDNPNCYYKQLQAKTDENIALKQQLDISVEALEFYANDKNWWNCENYNECVVDGDCGT